MGELTFNFKAIKAKSRLNKVKRDSESQKRFGHRVCTTSSNKEKDTPIKYGYHLEDYNKQCVYLHYYNNETLPFYVGQGTLQRAFVFSGNRRNNDYNNKAKDINLIRVEIYKLNIISTEGVAIEKELINKYKLIKDGGSLVNSIAGGRGGFIGKGKDHPCSRSIVQLDIYNNVIQNWDSISDASRQLNLDASSISKACNPNYRKKTCGGFKWKYCN